MSAVPQAPGDAPGRPASRGSGSGSRGTSPRGDGEPRAKRESRGSGFMATLARVKAPSLPMRLGDWAGAKQGEPPSVIAVNSSSNSKDSVPTDNLAGLGIVDASDGPLSPAVMPRLTYFNARGRAEVVRIMCAEAAFQYEDYRFRPNLENECRAPGQHDTTQRQCLCQTHGPGNDEFVEFRASGKSITGQVPLMEVEGLSICQTSAICRYLARKFGMAGSNPAEMAHVDMVASSIDDLYIFMVQSMIERKVDLDFYVGQWPMASALPCGARARGACLGRVEGIREHWKSSDS